MGVTYRYLLVLAAVTIIGIGAWISESRAQHKAMTRKPNAKEQRALQMLQNTDNGSSFRDR